MKQGLLTALLALIILLPARAQIQFSDSLRISLLTCTSGPDAYERFGHSGLRIQDLRQPQLDVTFHYGVFSFNAPHFIYRFVKGETDYMLGAVPTAYFIEEYRDRGLGMLQQELRLDSAQSCDLVTRLLINYRPENRTYRYSYFFDNCSTRPYHLINAATADIIRYDSAWVNALTLRQMVQERTGLNGWLDFGIALSVAGRADVPATYQEQMFLPDYLSGALDHAVIPVQTLGGPALLPVVLSRDTLLTMRPDVARAIAEPDPVAPATVFAILLLAGMLLTGMERTRQSRHWRMAYAAYDAVIFLLLGLTGCIVWFLNFFSLHPAVDHNLNCLWLLPTHIVLAILVWFSKAQRVYRIYCGITFALVILYIVLDWISGQYCPPAFLLLLAIILLRTFSRAFTGASGRTLNVNAKQ